MFRFWNSTWEVVAPYTQVKTGKLAAFEKCDGYGF